MVCRSQGHLVKKKLGKLAGLALALGLFGPAASAQAPAAWPLANVDSLPAGAFKDTVTYGRRLFNETYSVIGPEVSDPDEGISRLHPVSQHRRSGRPRNRGTRIAPSAFA